MASLHRGPTRPALLLTFLSLFSLFLTPLESAAAESCPQPGAWVDPANGERLAGPDLLSSLTERRFVLLGESHDSAADHRWQLHTLAGLGAHRPLAAGFEMLPRASQAALDRWTAGESDEAAFLEESRWNEVWGFDPDLYLPLFHYLRDNRLPAAALNVERALVSKVGQEGWAAVPLGEREGVGDPAPASEAYRGDLKRIFQQHGSGDDEGSFDEAAFQRFVEAQLTWDRAMAEALAELARAEPDRLVVGIAGRGHVQHGHGIPAQLQDLGFAEHEIAVLLPLPESAACEGLEAGLAEAVFVTENPPPGAMGHPGPLAGRPRLGIRIQSAEGGVEVMDVEAGSVADAAGLATGDLIVEAANETLAGSEDLIGIVMKQDWGSELPLRIRRAEESLELLAVFPPEAPDGARDGARDEAPEEQ